MFWIGLIIGSIIGGTIGLFVSALCTIAHRGDCDGKN